MKIMLINFSLLSSMNLRMVWLLGSYLQPHQAVITLWLSITKISSTHSKCWCIGTVIVLQQIPPYFIPFFGQKSKVSNFNLLFPERKCTMQTQDGWIGLAPYSFIENESYKILDRITILFMQIFVKPDWHWWIASIKKTLDQL